jgi:hypothetical protein
VLLALAGCGLFSEQDAEPLLPTRHSVGGEVEGLAGVAVRLTLNGTAASLDVLEDGAFTFPEQVDDGGAYAVAVVQQPAGRQCAVTDGQGTVRGADVTGVRVRCTGPALTVGGTATGVAGATVRLLLNDSIPLEVSADGAFRFPGSLTEGSPYQVTLDSVPVTLSCRLSRASGVARGAPVADVGLGCTPLIPAGAAVVAGRATYDWVPATSSSEGGVRLAYSREEVRPVRRARVELRDATTGLVLASGLTDDAGGYRLPLPLGASVKVRVYARSATASHAPDGTGPERCSGAGWDVRVVDNTRSGAEYAMEGASVHAAATATANLHAPLTFASGGYTARTAAPFALLDTVVSQLELVCAGDPAVALPPVKLNWSPANAPTEGTTGGASGYASGAIGTSHYTRLDGESNIFILGKDGVDTDEYDDHVVAHEFGHFLEDRLYRSDSIGGQHALRDALFAPVAFGEGYGNALSAMVFDDPIYVDTSGAGQGAGFQVDVGVAPQGQDRGTYSETSAQWFLWRLYRARRAAAPATGGFDRLHRVLAEVHRTTPALTTLHSFASGYRALFGPAAEGLQADWAEGLDTPADALCAGSCAGSGGGAGGVADGFDADNDVGAHYASRRTYPLGSTRFQDPDFWRLYRPLLPGTSAATGFDRAVSGGYTVETNKLAFVRAYRVTGLGGPMRVTATTAACGQDVLDLAVYRAGELRAHDFTAAGATAGCPSAAFESVAGETYVVLVRALAATDAWTMSVSP